MAAQVGAAALVVSALISALPILLMVSLEAGVDHRLDVLALGFLIALG
jgi:hypothetical protein